MAGRDGGNRMRNLKARLDLLSVTQKLQVNENEECYNKIIYEKED